jgi:menaquinone-dependent protoporphyrinogen oxidase
MRWAVVYATGEGQTGRIAAALAERLQAHGQTVGVHELRRGGAAVALDGVDRVVVAGSIHLGRFARRLVRWCAAHADGLARRRAVLITVSLTAAGDDAAEWSGLRTIVERFGAETGWRAQAIHHVPGRLAYSRYDPLTRWVMHRIARAHGLDAGLAGDVELTDWAAVRRLGDELAASA